MTYEDAKEFRNRLDADAIRYGRELKALITERTPLGLTPDHIKATPAYRSAKAKMDAAFANLRAFNAVFTRLFAKEIRADRRH